jgi:DNA-directed RNA polymerase specialized sigma24 family protein
MPSKGSVSNWLDQLQADDSLATQKLWERYFQRLVGLAHKKLQDLPRRALDEEDVALSVFDSFCRGARRGQFPQLLDRDNLWGLLVVLTSRKALNIRRDQRRQKRGGGAVRGESALAGPAGSAAGERGIEQIVAQEPSPEFALQVAEQCQRLLDSLGDDTLRSVAVRKMEGYSNEEIAAHFGCAPRTIERKLQRIRALWSREAPE